MKHLRNKAAIVTTLAFVTRFVPSNFPPSKDGGLHGGSFPIQHFPTVK